MMERNEEGRWRWGWRFLSAVLLLPGSVASASGGPSDGAAITAANRAGILRHCATLGFATQADVENARKVMRNRPAMPSSADLDTAEAAGNDGLVMIAGQRFALRDVEARAHQNLRQLCAGFVSSASVAASMIE